VRNAAAAARLKSDDSDKPVTSPAALQEALMSPALITLFEITMTVVAVMAFAMQVLSERD
jgi:hypothetical protein